MKKLIVGINDLATLHPEVGAEADGWDPTTVSAGSSQKLKWKCKSGHTWNAVVSNRSLGRNCPYCIGKKVWVGFNDLASLYPALAKEANGWDPKSITARSSQKLSWKCKLGHIWKTTPEKRSNRGDRCPYCTNKKVSK